MGINRKPFNPANVTVGHYRQDKSINMYVHEINAYTSNQEQFTNMRGYWALNANDQLFLILTPNGPVIGIQKDRFVLFIVENNGRQYWQQREWQPENEAQIEEAAHDFALMIENEHSELEAALEL